MVFQTAIAEEPYSLINNLFFQLCCTSLQSAFPSQIGPKKDQLQEKWALTLGLVAQPQITSYCVLSSEMIPFANLYEHGIFGSLKFPSFLFLFIHTELFIQISPFNHLRKLTLSICYANLPHVLVPSLLASREQQNSTVRKTLHYCPEKRKRADRT